MASKLITIDIEVNNIQKIKEFLSESLKLAEELEVKLNQIKQSTCNNINNEFIEEIEEVVRNLEGI